jgi:hypothetical protein
MQVNAKRFVVSVEVQSTAVVHVFAESMEAALAKANATTYRVWVEPTNTDMRGDYLTPTLISHVRACRADDRC